MDMSSRSFDWDSKAHDMLLSWLFGRNLEKTQPPFSKILP